MNGESKQQLIMYLLFCIILPLISQVLGNSNCDNASNERNHYVIETLADNFVAPYQLAFDANTNTLFFSYTVEKAKRYFKIVYMDVNTKEKGEVTGIPDGFAQTVDTRNHIVYMGGRNGIYQFDYKTKSANSLNITKESIWQMFFKDYLYYTTIYPDEVAYVYKNGVVSKVQQLENIKTLLIAVDNNNNIYYSNSSGLFVLDNANVTENIGEYNINGFTSDVKGNLYFSTTSEIYSIVTKNTVKKIADLNDDVHGVAIDADGNYIYSTYESVKRLKVEATNCS
ncbi:ommochrome-binding protein-like [Achroia grisella]|uniref:ommochrome-binding protein-like n=1 Tax=Achroia grisella TaxID=688607 RepID=UPI0027D338D9|nr:ommochrome-binding protein-like [Achroia grisella]